jgi:hypothetical protein
MASVRLFVFFKMTAISELGQERLTAESDGRDRGVFRHQPPADSCDNPFLADYCRTCRPFGTVVRSTA